MTLLTFSRSLGLTGHDAYLVFPPGLKRRGEGGGGFGQLLSYWSVHYKFILSFDVYTWKGGGAPKRRGVLHSPSPFGGNTRPHEI